MTDQPTPEEEAAPEFAAQGIPKAPVPTAFAWEAVILQMEGKQETSIALSMATPLGTQTYFMPPRTALTIADGLGKLAREMIVAEGNHPGVIVPNVNVEDVLKSLKSNGHV